MRKKGGSIELNLCNYTLNASHRLTSIIQNTPLNNSTLLIDFAYMHSDLPYGGRMLISINQLEDVQHKQYLKNLSQEGKNLIKEN